MQKRINIILSLILILGLFFRLYSLDRESLFMDEAVTAVRSLLPVCNLIKFLLYDGHSPLYFLIMHYWMKLFGAGEFALRFPSLIFGVASIYAMFLLARKLFNEKVAIFASYLFAVSTINIFYAQFARSYSMGMFFVLMSLLLLLESLEKDTKLSWLGYVSATLFALFLSVTTLPVLICQMLFIALLWSRYNKYVSFKKIVLIFKIILVIYLPFLLILLISSKQRLQINTLYFKPSPMAFIHIFDLFGGTIWEEGMYNPTRNPNLIIPAAIFSTMLFFLCLIGIFSLFRELKRDSTKTALTATVFLTLWLFLPILLIMPAFGAERYVLYASCPYYMLISQGIISLRGKIKVFLIFFIAAMGLIFLREYYHIQKRTDWRGISGYIKENIKEGEKTVFIARGFDLVEKYLLSYYEVPSLIAIGTRSYISPVPLNFEKEYYNIVRPQDFYTVEELIFDGIWLVFGRGIFDSPFSKTYIGMIKNLKERYVLIEKKELNPGPIFLLHFQLKDKNVQKK